MFQSDNEAPAAPKFNILARKQLLGALDGISIVRAIQRFEPDKMPIRPDCIGSVFCHPGVRVVRMYDQAQQDHCKFRMGRIGKAGCNGPP